MSLQSAFAAQPLDGRYVIFFSPHARADAFLVDTHTGKTWELVRYSYLDGEPRAWVLVDRIDNFADEVKFEYKHGKKPTGRPFKGETDKPGTGPPAGFQPAPPERR